MSGKADAPGYRSRRTWRFINPRVATGLVLLTLVAGIIFLTRNWQKTDAPVQQAGLQQVWNNPSVTSEPALLSTSSPLSRNNPEQQNNELDHYKGLIDMAEDRIVLNRDLALFLKKSPKSGNINLYNRYRRVRSDFEFIRNCRYKLEALDTGYYGRNRVTRAIADKEKDYIELESRLFAELEEIIGFTEEAYVHWSAYNNQHGVRLSLLDKRMTESAENTVQLFREYRDSLRELLQSKDVAAPQPALLDQQKN